MEFLSPPVAVKAIFFDVNGFVSCDARVTLSFIDLRLLQVPTGISRFYSGEYSQCPVSGSAARRVDFVPMHALRTSDYRAASAADSLTIGYSAFSGQSPSVSWSLSLEIQSNAWLYRRARRAAAHLVVGR